MLFVSREGQALASVRELLVDRGAVEQRSVSYLPASRAFLLRATLDDPGCRYVAATLAYHGGHECDFLMGRFALCSCPLCEIGAHNPSRRVERPLDWSRIRRLVNLTRFALQERTATDRANYQTLLAAHDAGNGPVQVADIGFSGTIPFLLHRLSGRPVHAHYLVSSGGRLPHGYPREVRVRGLYGPYAWGSGEPLVDHSLPLEALLTSDHGQLTGLRVATEGVASKAIEAVYEPSRLNPRHRDLLPRFRSWIADGASNAIERFGANVAQPATLELFRRAYASFTRYSLWPAEAAEILTVDDRMSGLATSRLPVQVHRPDDGGARHRASITLADQLHRIDT